MKKLNVQVTRAEEESVQGWLKRLSDLTVFPSQAQIYSKLISPYLPEPSAKVLTHFSTDEKNLSFQTGF